MAQLEEMRIGKHLTKERFIQIESDYVRATMNKPAGDIKEAKKALVYDRVLRRMCKKFGVDPVEIYQRAAQ